MDLSLSQIHELQKKRRATWARGYTSSYGIRKNYDEDNEIGGRTGKEEEKEKGGGKEATGGSLGDSRKVSTGGSTPVGDKTRFREFVNLVASSSCYTVYPRAIFLLSSLVSLNFDLGVEIFDVISGIATKYYKISAEEISDVAEGGGPWRAGDRGGPEEAERASPKSRGINETKDSVRFLTIVRCLVEIPRGRIILINSEILDNILLPLVARVTREGSGGALLLLFKILDLVLDVGYLRNSVEISSIFGEQDAEILYKENLPPSSSLELLVVVLLRVLKGRSARGGQGEGKGKKEEEDKRVMGTVLFLLCRLGSHRYGILPSLFPLPSSLSSIFSTLPFLSSLLTLFTCPSISLMTLRCRNHRHR
jgi:hypothetical protein